MARVIRDGSGALHTSDAPAPDNVRRLAARKLPRGIAWRLLFGGELGATGWFCVLLGHVCVLFLMSGQPEPKRRFVLLWMSAYGLVNILRQLRIGRRTLRLLRHGVPSWGTVVRQETVQFPRRGSPPIASTFGYPVNGGTPQEILVRTAHREFADGEQCWILHDAARPDRATVLRRAPGAPILLPDKDQIVLQRRLRVWPTWILPIASAVAAAMAARSIW